MLSHKLLTVALLGFPTLLNAQLSGASQASSMPIRGSMSELTTVLTGKVAVEASSQPPERTTVILECANTVKNQAYSDAKGFFTLSVAVNDATNSMSAKSGNYVSSMDWPSCEIYSDSPGYQSERLHVFGAPTKGIVQVGTIILHPLAHATEPTISVTSLSAPENAKKALQKGQDQEKKGKFAAACDYFKRAIAAYPRYALAWLELGRAQAKQNDFMGAQQSFQQAVTQDSGFLAGYVELARVAASQKNWIELREASAHLIHAAPDTSAEFWFLNSAANFNLGDMKQAETSIERALRLDSKHQVAQLEFLYGLILAKKQEYKSAVDHLNAYLQVSPNGANAHDAQALLVDYQKRADLIPPQ
jgi:tetratricopeptide (TPR) repeat protein